MRENQISAILDIIIGAILIALAIFYKGKNRLKSQEQKSLRKIFVQGMLFMALFDLESIITFLAAVKIVFDAHLGLFQDSGILVLDLVIAMSTMALPVALIALMPRRSAGFLSWLNHFIFKRGTLISKLVIMIIALYLIYSGFDYFC